MSVRKNQKDFTAAEWNAFIDAVNALHGVAAAAPAYRRFVSLHVDAMKMAHMNWSVHTMQMLDGSIMRGRNFLAWHRQFLKVFEDRLGVPVPYWDSVADRSIPVALDDPVLLAQWSVSRAWDPAQLADPADLAAAQTFTGTFRAFQTFLEGAVHAGTHNAVGGDMAGSASPTDPLFWLHHSFIDKTWADWQTGVNGDDPPNPTEVLKPAAMQAGVPFGMTVASVLDIATLGYSYA